MILRFGKYVLVQVGVYAVDFGSFWLLAVGLGLPPLVANAVAKVLAGVLGFMIHRRFTFEVSGQEGILGQGGRYGLLLALNVPVSSAMLYLTAMLLPLAAAKVAADVAGVALNFLLVHAVVFGRARPPEGAGGRA